MVTGLSCSAAASTSALSRHGSLSVEPQAWRRRNLPGPAPAVLLTVTFRSLLLSPATALLVRRSRWFLVR